MCKIYSVDFNDNIKNISPEIIKKSKELFYKNGFVVLKNSISKNIILKVKKDLENTIKKNKISNKLRDIHFFKNGKVSSAHNLFNYIDSYKKLSNAPNVLKVIKNVYKKISKTNFNSSYFAKPKLQGLETKPHQDNAFFCMEPADIATCWMPITFANKKNGCLYYFSGSHVLGDLEHIPEGNLGASMCLTNSSLKKVKKNFEKTYIELELGDCVIHNALVVHGSEANISDFNRNAFNFSIGSKFAIKNKSLYKAYKSRLDLFLSKKQDKIARI
jgi:phytanoyl-CoA hydroxylase